MKDFEMRGRPPPCLPRIRVWSPYQAILRYEKHATGNQGLVISPGTWTFIKFQIFVPPHLLYFCHRHLRYSISTFSYGVDAQVSGQEQHVKSATRCYNPHVESKRWSVHHLGSLVREHKKHKRLGMSSCWFYFLSTTDSCPADNADRHFSSSRTRFPFLPGRLGIQYSFLRLLIALSLHSLAREVQSPLLSIPASPL